ncbi:MAG: PAS domain S-box protein [Candidatus Methanomethylicus sp.]|nr:PAS domain S-box protein [Candidatus Methanomethylicus sp.]
METPENCDPLMEYPQYREKERVLKECKELYRAVFEISGAMFVFSMDGIIRLVNSQLERILLRPRIDVEGKPWTSLFSPEDRMKAERCLAEAEEHSSSSCELRLIGEGAESKGKNIALTISITQPGNVRVAIVRDQEGHSGFASQSNMSEEQYRGIVEGANSVIFKMNTEGTILTFNEYAEDLFGFRREEVIGRSIYETILPRRESTGRDLSGLVAGICTSEKYSQHVNENLKKNGEKVWVQWYNKPLRDGEGNVVGVLCVGNDLSDSKRMQEELVSTIEKLREVEGIINRSPAVVILFRALEGYPIELVSENIKQFGHPSLDFSSGKLWFKDLVYPDDYQRFSAELVRNTALGKGEFSHEFRIITAKGDARWVEQRIMLRRDPDGRVTHYQGIMLDITDRKVSDEDRRKSLALLMATLESTADGILVVDWAGRVVIFNRKFVEMWGIPDSVMATKDYDIIMSSARDLLKEPESIGTSSAGLQISQDSEKSTFEFKDGRMFERYMHPQEIGDKIMGIVISFRDITELKKADDRLRRHLDALEKLVEEKTKQLRNKERFAAVGETATMVGHDLRNPLQVIVNKLYLAKMELEESKDLSPETAKSMLSTIESLEGQVNYMNKIVTDLQDYAREAKPNLACVKFDVLVANFLGMVKVPEKVCIALDIEKGLEVMVDAEMMARVMVNLVNNGIQAMPNGGKLIISGMKKDDSVFIAIKDSGQGITEEDLEKLFRPLFTTKAKGMGFGLAVVKRLVEAHNGRISVESKVGQGTAFTIELPYQPRDEPKFAKLATTSQNL